MKQYQLTLTDGELSLLKMAVYKAEKAYREDGDLFNRLMIENAGILLEHRVSEAKKESRDLLTKQLHKI